MLGENRRPGNRFDRPAVKLGLVGASVFLAILIAHRTIAPPQGMVTAALNLVTDGFVSPPMVPIAPDYLRLAGTGETDDVRGHRLGPNAWIRQRFPDNPRGYFFSDPSPVGRLLTDWCLMCRDGRDMRIRTPHASDRLIVTLTQSDAQSPSWRTLQLRRRASLGAGQSACLSVQMVADPPREVNLQFEFFEPSGSRTEQYSFLVGHELSHLTAISSSTSGESPLTARVLLGNRAGDVEVSDIRLHPAPAEEAEPRPYFVEYQTNRWGFRERDVSPDCPPNVVRIACLGDSNTYGQGVHFEDTYPQVLERMCNLNRADGSPVVEVLNFGIPGYATDAEYDVYVKDAERFGAKIVLVQLCWNDALSTVEDLRLFTETGVSDARNYCDALSQIVKEQGYKRTIEYLARLHERCRDNRAALVVGVMNTRPGWQWDQMIAEVLPAMQARGIPTFEIGELSIQAGMEGEEGIVHPSDHHPSEKGHLLFAREIKRVLDEQQLLP